MGKKGGVAKAMKKESVKKPWIDGRSGKFKKLSDQTVMRMDDADAIEYVEAVGRGFFFWVDGGGLSSVCIIPWC